MLVNKSEGQNLYICAAIFKIMCSLALCILSTITFYIYLYYKVFTQQQDTHTITMLGKFCLLFDLILNNTVVKTYVNIS